MMSKDSSFIDTDIIYKLGEYSNEDLLSKVLLSLDLNLYIHEYIMSEELILKNNSKNQLEAMFSNNKISVMRLTDLNESELVEYKSTEELLAKEMNVNLSKVRDRNAGEVKSMALAYTKNFSYFISDDRGARVAAKKHLQNLDGSSLNTINMKDIICHIRNKSDKLNITRKIAKQLYLFSVNPKIAQDLNLKKKLTAIHAYLKKNFDENLWPINKTKL